MTHASLFSGIGGAEVAAAMLGWENVFHCEINPFCRRVLEYWFPNSKSYEDITKTHFDEWRGRVDVLTGGFPCQPFSYAGKRGGANDDRYLWPYMCRAISEIRPTWVIGENVAGIATMVEQGEIVQVGEQTSLFGETDTLRSYELRQRFTLERVCSDLEHIGYSVQPIVVPACAVGAPHRRDRVFILAQDTMCLGFERGDGERQHSSQFGHTCPAGTDGQVQRDIPNAESEQGEGRRPQLNDACRERQAQLGRGSGEDGHGRSATDTDIRGTRTPGESGAAQAVGSHQHAEQSERLAEAKRSDGLSQLQQPHSNSNGGMCEGWHESGLRQTESRLGTETLVEEKRRDTLSDFGLGQRWAAFPSVSPVHRGNDGIPFDVDCLSIPFGQWRDESLKAYGNAIVPQVMYEIFRALASIGDVRDGREMLAK